MRNVTISDSWRPQLYDRTYTRTMKITKMNTASKNRVQNEHFEPSLINFGKSAGRMNFGHFFSERPHCAACRHC